MHLTPVWILYSSATSFSKSRELPDAFVKTFYLTPLQMLKTTSHILEYSQGRTFFLVCSSTVLVVEYLGPTLQPSESVVWDKRYICLFNQYHYLLKKNENWDLVRG